MTMKIEVSHEFTRYPGPRYRIHGDYSGQQFREDVLSEKLKAAIDANDTLIVVLDDVAGYGSSFLEEAFGGLVRQGFSKSTLDRHLKIVARTERFKHHAYRAQQYIEEASRREVALH